MIHCVFQYDLRLQKNADAKKMMHFMCVVKFLKSPRGFIKKMISFLRNKKRCARDEKR
jgi:hypothetical protein